MGADSINSHDAGCSRKVAVAGLQWHHMPVQALFVLMRCAAWHVVLMCASHCPGAGAATLDGHKLAL